MNRNNSENKEPSCCSSERNNKGHINWNAWYFALLAFLVIQIIAFALITKYYEQ